MTKKTREVVITKSDNQPDVYNLRWEEDGALVNWTFKSIDKALAHVKKIFTKKLVQRVDE